MSSEKIGPLRLSGFIIGPILGSGILILPPLGVEVMGEWAIFGWVVMVCLSFMFAFMFGFLSMQFPGDAGVANAVEHAFGTGFKQLTAFYLTGAALFDPVAVLLTVVKYVNLGTGVPNAQVAQRPRLLSDNGPCYISKSLRQYLEEHNMAHTRGKPFHPMTQGKIERYHRSMKNIILLDNYYLPTHLEVEIAKWVQYYNNERYHESLDNITPRDKYLGREESIFAQRRKIKKQTINRRREVYRNQQLRAGNSAVLPVS
jgi:hypothetical protein